MSHRPTLLVVSNGHAEDLFGARLLDLLALPRTRALPLVGSGRAYEGLSRVIGPRTTLPSGGFPFSTPQNLRADLQAGLVPDALRQWRAGLLEAEGAQAVAVVGDAYALMVGFLAARGRPVYHLQPLVSVLYGQDMRPADHLRQLNEIGANLFMPWEVALSRRARAVFTRDAASAAHLRARGVRAEFAGSFAMDLLGPPERDLSPLRDDRPLLALLPGTREDARASLPRMLEVCRALPEMQGVAAWGRPWSELQPPPGWTLEDVPGGACLARDGTRVWVLRGAFAAVVRAARLALGTAGTAAEQAAGLGVPVVGFPTQGPQYTEAFARRQRRLLGEALTLVPNDPAQVAAALRTLLADRARYAAASRAGCERIGEGGAFERIAARLRREVDFSI
ncbi:uncharacterized protein (TIGR03492 family) [Deinobacterium chartae]|uniref:Uncharacterized protein (TIGR03492 family) n=1 Tax=Deinobacterium chartae TaxID=521158 RepID=A0A841I0T5_9DEIO|nr:lipid-A-disaccharide synthase-related protein [Deinobacterium chartae]MBB6099277.1 uncharacterized protein (TIGR03492 family) [Deinobacterium chartae]